MVLWGVLGIALAGVALVAAWPHLGGIAEPALAAYPGAAQEYEPDRSPQSLRDAVRLRLTTGFEHTAVLTRSALGSPRVRAELERRRGWYDAIIISAGDPGDSASATREGVDESLLDALAAGGRILLEEPVDTELALAILTGARSREQKTEALRLEVNADTESYAAVILARDARAWVEYYPPPEGCRRSVTAFEPSASP